MTFIESHELFKMIQQQYPQNICAGLYDDPRIDTYYINILPKICVVLHGTCECIDTITIVKIPSLKDNMNYDEFKEFINLPDIFEEELFALELEERRFDCSEKPYETLYLEQMNEVFEILQTEFRKLI